MFNRQPQEPRPINGIGDAISQSSQSGNVIIENGSGIVESLGAIQSIQTETTQSMEAKPKDPKMQAIENAVRELIKADPNFHTNIAKLAQIAQKSPGIYKMAVQYLSTL
jgi:ATP phosphoribosyltransferase